MNKSLKNSLFKNLLIFFIFWIEIIKVFFNIFRNFSTKIRMQICNFTNINIECY